MSDNALPTLALTGSTGILGGLVAKHLTEADVPVRLLARDPERAPRLSSAVAVLSRYSDDAETRRSLEGVRTLFMLSASEGADRLQQHRAFIDAAARAGVRHIVYTSFYGAAPDAVFTLARDHWATELHIAESGMTHTFLRDNFYIDLLPSFVGDDGVIRGPAGAGRVAAVARQDVARVAATVLMQPERHAGLTYNLTGPEALTMGQVAEILTKHTGRSVRFHTESLAEAYESRRRWPAPQWQYDAWVSTYTAIAAGDLAAVTDDVRIVTGRRPVAFEQFLKGEGRADQSSSPAIG